MNVFDVLVLPAAQLRLVHTAIHASHSKGLQDKSGMIIGAEVKDTLSGKSSEVYAKQVINATGPFTDSLRQLSDPSKPSIIMPSAGLVTPAACFNACCTNGHKHHSTSST